MTKQLQQRISNRQREALAMIRESGERVVIEDGWLIYLADSQKCPFGVRNSRVSDDVAYVRAHMKPCSPHDVVCYRARRSQEAKDFGALAIELIQSGRYEDAQAELKKADHYSLSARNVIELYEMEKES